MSVEPIVRVPSRALSVPTVRRAELIAPAVVAVGFAVLVVLTWATWGDPAHDTGYDWVAAERLADGQIPYADFPYIYGPLGVGLLGGAFALLGASTGTVIAAGLVLAVAAVVLTYRLGLELTGPLGAALAAGSTAVAAVGTGNMGLISPHAVTASVAVVLSLALVLAGARFAASGHRPWLALAGLATGLGTLTRPEFAAALVLAPALWLGLRLLRAAAAERRAALKDAALWAAVAFAVPVVVYGLVLTQATPSQLVDSLLPSEQLSAGSDVILKAGAPMTASSVARLLADLALYAALAGAMLGAAMLIARGGTARKLVLAAVAVAALGFAAALVVNPEAIRSRLEYAYAWIPAGAALATIVLAVRARHGDEWTVRDQAALLLAALLTVVAAKTYAAFAPHPNPRFSQFALYALPLAALFMTWLHLEVLPRRSSPARGLGIAWLAALLAAGAVLVANDARAETMTISGPGGSLTATPDQGAAYQSAVDAIVARTRPGEPVLLAPQMSALYTVTGRTDPLPAISLLPGALTDAGEQAAIERMGDVRLVVTDRRPLTEYGQGAFGVSYNRRLGAWLRSDFRRVATYRGVGAGAVTLDLWQRR